MCVCVSFSLSLGGHSTKVRHCHATTLFESSRARTGEKAKKEELVRLSVCLVIIAGSESWWILVPRVLFVYPYTMRHGKYFDETFFFPQGDRYHRLEARIDCTSAFVQSMTRDDENLLCRPVLFARIEYFNDIKKYICTTIRGMSYVYNSNF